MTANDPVERGEPWNVHKWLRGNLAGASGLLIILLVMICALFAPQLSPGSPTEINWTYAHSPPVWNQQGTSQRILGADELGRDVLTRLIYGTRVSLAVGLGDRKSVV